MKAAVFAIPFLTLAAFQVPAQERPRQPEIIVGGDAPRTNDTRADDNRQPRSGGAAAGREGGRFERCVDVVIGSETSFGCLNEKLRQQVKRVNPPVTNTPPIDAKSQDIKVGVVNIPAVQEQFGKNFGVSAFPFRPPPPVFGPPIGGAGRH
jgi:hypothetical protein